MSLRLKRYRLNCSKPGCAFEKVLPLFHSSDKYLLSDKTTVSADAFYVDGWCNSCKDFCKIFSPKSLAQIKTEMFDIEDRFNKSGFLGFNKTRSHSDISLFERNKKILDLLIKRKNNSPKCMACNGEDIKILDIETLFNHKTPHPNCSGHFTIEEGLLVIGSKLGYGSISFKNFDELAYKEEYEYERAKKGRLLDENDNFLSHL